jgi:hypothetical protein
MINGIAKALSSASLSKAANVAGLLSKSNLSLKLPNNLLGGLKGQVGADFLAKLTATLDAPGNKTLAANPAIRDVILALQKQTGAGNAKAVTNAYSKF